MDTFSPDSLAPLLVTYGLKIVGVIVSLIVMWVVAGWVRRAIRKTLFKTHIDETIAKFIANLTRYAILLMGLLGVLEYFGFETTSFAAMIGAAGLAIGLALQGTLGNFSSGLMILMLRPFKVGDYVEVNGGAGFVDQIGLFTTWLDTPDNQRLYVPNRDITGATIRTVTHHTKRRVEVSVGSDYGDNLPAVRDVLLEAAHSVEGRLDDPAPDVYLNGLGDSSIDWTVRVWVNNTMGDYLTVRERLTYAVKQALDDAGLNIPFPQLDVHLDRAEE